MKFTLYIFQNSHRHRRLWQSHYGSANVTKSCFYPLLCSIRF